MPKTRTLSRALRVRRNHSSLQPISRRRWAVILSTIGVCVTVLITGIVARFGDSAYDLVRDTIVDERAGDMPFDSVVADRAPHATAMVLPGLKSLEMEALREGTGENRAEFRMANNGADVNTTTLQLTLTNKRSQEIRLLEMRSKITSRDDPMQGTLVSPGSAGAPDEVGLGFDLDSQESTAKAVKGLTEITKLSYFRVKTHTFKPGEQETFHILANSLRFDVTWELELEVLVDDKVVKQTVRASNGKQFRTTGLAERDLNYYLPLAKQSVYSAVYIQCMESGIGGPCNGVSYGEWARAK